MIKRPHPRIPSRGEQREFAAQVRAMQGESAPAGPSRKKPLWRDEFQAMRDEVEAGFQTASVILQGFYDHNKKGLAEDMRAYGHQLRLALDEIEHRTTSTMLDDGIDGMLALQQAIARHPHYRSYLGQFRHQREELGGLIDKAAETMADHASSTRNRLPSAGSSGALTR